MASVGERAAEQVIAALAVMIDDGFAVAIRRVDAANVSARAVRHDHVVQVSGKSIQGVIRALHGKISEGAGGEEDS